MKQIKKEIEILEFLKEQILEEKDTYSFIIKKYEKVDIVSRNFEFLENMKNIVFTYNKFLNSIKQMLKNRKKEMKKGDLIFRIAAFYSIDAQNSTLDEISKYLVHGSEIVKNKVQEKINENMNISKTIINLSSRFIMFQASNIKMLELYIKN